MGEKGYFALSKLSKNQPSEQQKSKRVVFCKRHEDKTPDDWKHALEAVGDVKEYTWYPVELRAKFNQLRASWTYMNDKERYQGAFQRPKRWFPKKEWDTTRHQRVFGMTTSTGKILTFLVPKPWTSEDWAIKLEKKVAPFLKKCFPNKRDFVILLDGEPLLHAPPAKRSMAKFGISVLPGWPKYSAELNPQENVWPKGEVILRDLEKPGDSFETFQKNVEKAVRMYPSPEKLVPSMTKRVKECLERGGDPLRK